MVKEQKYVEKRAEEMDLQTILFMFFGGLGIFLYGIKSMGDGLQKAAGDGLRDLLDRFTTNPFWVY